MTQIDPGKLVAYLDRELDGAEARSVERAVAATRPWRRGYGRCRTSTSPRAAYDPVMTAPLPPW